MSCAAVYYCWAEVVSFPVVMSSISLLSDRMPCKATATATTACVCSKCARRYATVFDCCNTGVFVCVYLRWNNVRVCFSFFLALSLPLSNSCAVAT